MTQVPSPNSQTQPTPAIPAQQQVPSPSDQTAQIPAAQPAQTSTQQNLQNYNQHNAGGPRKLRKPVPPSPEADVDNIEPEDSKQQKTPVDTAVENTNNFFAKVKAGG